MVIVLSASAIGREFEPRSSQTKDQNLHSFVCFCAKRTAIMRNHVRVDRHVYQRTGVSVNKGNNKITELRTILQRESQNS